MRRISFLAVVGVGLVAMSAAARAEEPVALGDSLVRVQWKQEGADWKIAALTLFDPEQEQKRWNPVGVPSGEYTILYSETAPKAEDVVRNTEGTAYHFFPSAATPGKGTVQFTGACDAADVSADWSLDSRFAGDIQVTLTLTAKKRGYFSLASPTLTTLTPQRLFWGMIPGYWQGTGLQPDFDLAFKYGQGIPGQPVLARERTATTLAPLLTEKNKDNVVSFAAIPEPGQSRDPWASDKSTQTVWRMGLSLMNRKGGLSPTVYAPVLGQEGSLLEAGQKTTLRFRYSLRPGEWPAVYKHAAEDIYRFADGLQIKQPQNHSLTQRMKLMQAYVDDAQTSLWQTDTAGSIQIGAQSYLGGVKGATKGEAMKNSDLGAMWMLAQITGDPVLAKERLPLVRAFKLAQQQTEPGFFQGAALGQYWLRNQDKFVEEWGPYVEPIGLTYYTLIDIGNILLFTPNDAELKDRLRLGADTLLRWQKKDGSWDVAYNRAEPHDLAYPKLTDLRPTWYGLLVAYRILGDDKYLKAAKRGADWFLKNAVDKGSYLGVCGDADFVTDFAMGQSAQCLLDLYANTQDGKYRAAAIRTARLFWTWTFTHPIPSNAPKTVKETPRQDWEITQTGLSMEHGGTRGSANALGPIQLCSHAGMFIRFYERTGEKLFLDMARHAALGRDAFVDPKSGVASYYWRAMQAGPGAFPHHAWWQFGWIMDYLLAETHFRTNGKIDFPHGFVTPKVGPQQSVGFLPGTVYGQKAALWMPPSLFSAESTVVDVIGARSTTDNTLYVVALSEHHEPVETTITIADPDFHLSGLRILAGTGRVGTTPGTYVVTLPPYGITVMAVAREPLPKSAAN